MDRPDQNLPAEGLKALSDIDPDRFLLEWTFRLEEVDALRTNPESFLIYLTETYCKNSQDNGLRTAFKKRDLERFTASYLRGQITLSDWTSRARYLVTGYLQERIRVAKPDPELRAAYAHLYPHLFKGTD